MQQRLSSRHGSHDETALTMSKSPNQLVRLTVSCESWAFSDVWHQKKSVGVCSVLGLEPLGCLLCCVSTLALLVRKCITCVGCGAGNLKTWKPDCFPATGNCTQKSEFGWDLPHACFFNPPSGCCSLLLLPVHLLHMHTHTQFYYLTLCQHSSQKSWLWETSFTRHCMRMWAE